MIPLSGLARAINELRAVAKETGRAPNEVGVKSPGHVTITNNPERAEQPRWDGCLLRSPDGDILFRATQPIWLRR